MNNRLTMQEVAGLLSEHTGKDKQQVERFLKEFIALVTEGVYTDKIVKVKGLGTFKIILVDKRESVHVNTGERFIIPEHYKFSFVPDKELKELVNKPFSFFESTEVNEGVDFSELEETEEEDKEAAPEDETVEEVMPDREIPIPEEKPEPVEEPQPPVPPALPEIEKPQEPEQPVETEITELPPPPPETFPEERFEEPDGPQDLEKEAPRMAGGYSDESDFPDEYYDSRNGMSAFKRAIVAFFVIAVIVIGSVGFYLNRDYVRDFIYGVDMEYPVDTLVSRALYAETDRQAEEEIKEILESVDVDTLALSSIVDTMAPETTEKEVKATVEPEPKVSEKPAAEPATAPASAGVIARVKIERGSRLTLIALKYYGSKVFWVYLYEYNKARISDPNNVPVGTEIEVPAPELYGIDVHNGASVRKASALQTEILTARE